MLDTAAPYGNGSIVTPLPWQRQVWDRLAATFNQGSLSHAYLIQAEQGTGAEQLADAMLSALLCESDALHACGECESCQLLKAGTHPDAFKLGLEDTAVLKVDQIRAAIRFSTGTAARGGYRCIVITPAEAMNVNAANALLKLLEEPGEKTVLMLVSYLVNAVPATVKSRCQIITPSITRSHIAEVERYFDQYGVGQAYYSDYYFNRPLLALAESAKDAQPSKVQVEQVFEDLLNRVADSTEFYDRLKNIEPVLLVDHLYLACLNTLQNKQSDNHHQLYQAIDQLIEFKRLISDGGTINHALFYQRWCTQLVVKNQETRLWA